MHVAWVRTRGGCHSKLNAFRILLPILLLVTISTSWKIVYAFFGHALFIIPYQRTRCGVVHIFLALSHTFSSPLISTDPSFGGLLYAFAWFYPRQSIAQTTTSFHSIQKQREREKGELGKHAARISAVQFYHQRKFADDLAVSQQYGTIILNTTAHYILCISLLVQYLLSSLHVLYSAFNQVHIFWQLHLRRLMNCPGSWVLVIA